MSLAIGKRTDSLSTFVFVCEEELIQAIVPEGFEEPFTITWYLVCLCLTRDGITYMYGPGSPLSALKQRAVSSMSTGPPTFAMNLVYSSFVRVCSGKIEKDLLQCPQRADICLEQFFQLSLESRVDQLICFLTQRYRPGCP